MSTSYRGRYRRRTSAPTAGRIAKANARPGPCRDCGEEIPAHGGQLYREGSGAWSVVHVPREWAGSPVSGRYAGGCPAETDRMNAEGRFGGASGPLPERERIASVAATGAAMAERDKPPRGGRYAYTGSGARMTSRQGRCEDAPCCGCCD
jgi:hypothetical protein